MLVDSVNESQSRMESAWRVHTALTEMQKVADPKLQEDEDPTEDQYYLNQIVENCDEFKNFLYMIMGRESARIRIGLERGYE